MLVTAGLFIYALTSDMGYCCGTYLHLGHLIQKQKTELVQNRFSYFRSPNVHLDIIKVFPPNDPQLTLTPWP